MRVDSSMVRFFVRSILCGGVLLFAANSIAAPTQQELNETLKNLQQTKESEAALKKRLAATERELQTLRERAAALGEQLQQSEARVDAEEGALLEANREYAAMQKEFESRKNDYSATVLGLLRMHRLPMTAALSSPEDAQELLRTAGVLEKTNALLAEKATRLRADIAKIKKLRSVAKQRDSRTRASQTELKRERAKLMETLADRQKLQATLSADHARAEEKVAELSRASKSLQELLAKLAANEKTQARFDPPAAKPDKLRDFEGKKGSLSRPVTGQVLHRFGDKQEDGGGTYRGMVFKARGGAMVVAPYDGKVAFTGPFRDYGNMVLIKHKNGYISLIAGLGSLQARLNQTIIRGEPLGAMPEGASAKAYVELRDRDAKPIDPTDWFANVVRKAVQN